MNMNWIITSPITQYGILAASLLLTLVLFVSMKFEMSAARRRSEESREALENYVRGVESAVDNVRQSVAEIEERPAAEPASGMNSARRTMAIRMHHRGESVETIAAALKTPRNAVELLLKVQALVHDRIGAGV